MGETRDQSTASPPPTSLTAAATARRRPGVRYDKHGVVIGPWTASVKRANALLRASR